jgi:hypothetical protein
MKFVPYRVERKTKEERTNRFTGKKVIILQPKGEGLQSMEFNDDAISALSLIKGGRVGLDVMNLSQEEGKTDLQYFITGTTKARLGGQRTAAVHIGTCRCHNNALYDALATHFGLDTSKENYIELTNEFESDANPYYQLAVFTPDENEQTWNELVEEAKDREVTVIQ